MACGTPILAFKEGAVPEIVADGKTGFVVNSVGSMIEAVNRIDSIDPYECRRHVHDNFSIISMAQKYLELYQWIFDGHKILNNRNRGIDPDPTLTAKVKRNSCLKTFR